MTGVLEPRGRRARALRPVAVTLTAGETLPLRIRLARKALKKAGRGTLTLTFTTPGATPLQATVKLKR